MGPIACGRAFFSWLGKAKGSKSIFLDFTRFIQKTSELEVKEEYLNLISHLCRWSQWERVFKGRDVLFKWLAWDVFSNEERHVLEMAGVEPFEFPRAWEEGKGDG